MNAFQRSMVTRLIEAGDALLPDYRLEKSLVHREDWLSRPRRVLVRSGQARNQHRTHVSRLRMPSC